MYKYVPLWPERYLVIYLFIVHLFLCRPFDLFPLKIISEITNS